MATIPNNFTQRGVLVGDSQPGRLRVFSSVSGSGQPCAVAQAHSEKASSDEAQRAPCAGASHSGVRLVNAVGFLRIDGRRQHGGQREAEGFGALPAYAQQHSAGDRGARARKPAKGQTQALHRTHTCGTP